MHVSSELPNYWFNVTPYLEKVLKFSIPPLLDPRTGKQMNWETLAESLPSELAKIELSQGVYKSEELIEIPNQVLELYKNYRPTPLVRAHELEKMLNLSAVKLFYKREDLNEIGSYKLNSSYPQAYYAKQDSTTELIADTGPGNWGLGMALAARHFDIPLTIYMEQENYNLKISKVLKMQQFGASVIPIKTPEGTTASSISIAMQHVHRNATNKLSLGCLASYSALHNTIIGLELSKQLELLEIKPDIIVGVVGGGSSFSGLVFPFIKRHKEIIFMAIESESVPSFTKGIYQYENPDTVGLMPRAMMYTLGNKFIPKSLNASGLNYHGKNPLLSLLVNKGIVQAKAYPDHEVANIQELFKRTEGISAATESCFAIKGAIELAKRYNKQNKNIIFTITGNTNSLE